jgi:prepilin-type N-terminal cleavage/methylation domain-containing protein
MAMKSRRAGFTLVELMIALIAGSVAVIAVYYLSGVSSRAYQEQMRVAETQQSLRSAMEQLRRDISRAGYLGIPNSSTLAPDCSGTMGGADVAPRQVRAVDIVHNGSIADNTTKELLGLGGTAVNKTRADVLRMWGNYATADAYLTDPITTSDTVIHFQEASESFRRSFHKPEAANGVAQFQEKRFEEVFVEGRMLRVEQDGRFFFRDIASANKLDKTVTLKTALPSCFDPTHWTAVAPIVRVRYQVEADTRDTELARISLVPQDSESAASPRLPGTRRTLLVRREETDGTGDEVPASSRVVLDYAVEFAVDAVINKNPVANYNQLPEFEHSTGSAVTAQSTTAPEMFHALIVTLSTRSTDADPKLPHLARARFNQAGLLDSPLLTFRVIDPLAGRENMLLFSRVRTMRSEIYLQNL